MERRDFLKIAFGTLAGTAAVAIAAKAAPLAPQSLLIEPPPDSERGPQPAVATGEDLGLARVEQVHWHHRYWHRRHWRRRRYWGYRGRYWRRRRYWRRGHYWHRRYYWRRRHYWRRRYYW